MPPKQDNSKKGQGLAPREPPPAPLPPADVVEQAGNGLWFCAGTKTQDILADVERHLEEFPVGENERVILSMGRNIVKTTSTSVFKTVHRLIPGYTHGLEALPSTSQAESAPRPQIPTPTGRLADRVSLPHQRGQAGESPPHGGEPRSTRGQGHGDAERKAARNAARNRKRKARRQGSRREAEASDHIGSAITGSANPQGRARARGDPAQAWQYRGFRAGAMSSLSEGSRAARVEAQARGMVDDRMFAYARQPNTNCSCGNCGQMGHELADCAWPSRDGYIHGCPYCNTKAHEQDCPRYKASDRLVDRLDWAVLRCGNKPPRAVFADWAVPAREAVDGPEAALVPHGTRFPWSDAFPRQLAEINEYPWESEHRTERLPVDTETGNIKQIKQFYGELSSRVGPKAKMATLFARLPDHEDAPVPEDPWNEPGADGEGSAWNEYDPY